MRAAAQDSMLDVCTVGTLSVGTSGAYTTQTIAWSANTVCGFDAGGGSETRDNAQFPTNAARLRLPLGTAITATSRVRIVSKAGVALSPQPEFKVVGAPAQGPTCLVVDLELMPAKGTG